MGSGLTAITGPRPFSGCGAANTPSIAQEYNIAPIVFE
jgi:hypothetical protein